MLKMGMLHEDRAYPAMFGELKMDHGLMVEMAFVEAYLYY
jgi:hypothetical protein